MNTKEFVKILEDMNACKEAVKWVEKQKDPYTAWRSCINGDWMDWLVERLYDHLTRSDYNVYDGEVIEILDEWSDAVPGSLKELQTGVKLAKAARKGISWSKVKEALERYEKNI